MSPRKSQPANPRAALELRRVAGAFGVRLRDARIARGWSVTELAERAGLSPDMVYRIESGAPASAGTMARIAVALDRRLEFDIVERRRRPGANLSTDMVHSAMGELEAIELRRRGYGVGIDEPYQHYQFAGRADVVAWDADRRALLHLENRTRFPDFQEMAGAYNAKRAYLGAAMAQRLGVRRWASETHVIVAVWTAEVLHSLRLRTGSFQALCPDGPEVVGRWLSGSPPVTGSTSSLIVFDPLAGGRRERFVGLDRALTARPRHHGYAEVRSLLEMAA